MPHPQQVPRPSPKVLWVGPPAQGQVLARSLGQAGLLATVVRAKDLEDALDRLGNNPPSIVVLDVASAPAGAPDAVQRLLAAEPRVPVLVVADEEHPESGLNAVDAGAQDWFARERLTDAEFVSRVVAATIEVQRLRVDLAAAADGGRDAPTIARQAQELEALKELNRSRMNLLNTAAHELSTPLTPVLLQIQILRQSGPMNQDQEDSLRILDRNLARLEHLIRDILDVARLESRRLRLEKQVVDLAKLAADTVAAYKETARKGGITLELDAPGPVEAWADPRRIGQVLDNLTSNAVKFTPAGGRVRLRVLSEHDEAVVHVEDTGRGLRPQDFARLFQPFSQVHDTMQQTRAGAGLGLYICQGLIEQHAGRIWCDSPGPGKGAVFSFALPAEAAVSMAETVAARPGKGKEAPARMWPLIHFKCPECGSRDIQMRILKNRYECGACKHAWR